MNKNNKEYIVTKIEKYDEMYEDDISYESAVKYIINFICLIIFSALSHVHLTSLPDDLDIVINQIFHDVCLFGLAITSYNNYAKAIKMAYVAIMSKIWNDKLQKNDIENQIEITIENKEGKTR